MSHVQDVRAVNTMVDFDKSIGNYMVDADGNTFLDVYAQIASIPVGYNNPNLMKAAQSTEFARALMNRPALGNFPPSDWADTITETFLGVAPPKLNKVYTAMCGSCANETAYKAAFIYQRRKARGNSDFSPEDLASCMDNKAPGSPDAAILSFTGGFHGRMFGSLSTTHSKAIHKIDVPAFDWPQAPFPALKYPLEENAAYNDKEEERCLEALNQAIQNSAKPIAAIVVEPIQSEGGDNHASPRFFQGVRDITARHGVLMIVDEVQTGVGSTGTFWCHEKWNLSTPPDIVTFSKKFQAAGWYFSNPELVPNLPYRQFNTWMGDPVKALVARSIVQEIKQHNLVANTASTGEYLYSKLEELQQKYPSKFQDLRGKGQGHIHCMVTQLASATR